MRPSPQSWAGEDARSPLDDSPRQAEVMRDLAAYLAVFVAIALGVSLLAKTFGSG
jgi:hypothetical protein